MTKQEEEVVSFAATPKGFVREVREEEKENPKDEVKPEPSARKLGSSNRSFATVLGALSAMILGGALATYSVSFEYAIFLHEKAVSYFPWSWLHVYTGTSDATLELFLIGIAASSTIIFAGLMLLPKLIAPAPGAKDHQPTEDPAATHESTIDTATTTPDPLNPPAEPPNTYETMSLAELLTEWESSQQTVSNLDMNVKAIRSSQKWERERALEMQNEINRRMRPQGVQFVSSKVVPPPLPKPRKEENSGKANGKNNGANLRKDAQPPASGEQTQKAGEDLKEELKEALHEQDEMEEQAS